MAYEEGIATPLLDESTFFLMGIAHRLFRNQAQEQLMEHHDISVEMQKALEILSFHGEMLQQGLADKLMTERSTVKRLVDNMLKRELVAISAHPTNQKVRLIKLTEKGVSVHKSGNQIITSVQRQWLDQLGDDKQAQLKSALTTLIEKS
ncbi:MarR family winged helix-turn-helix transcriptional regulator [Vibrio sp. WXL210]|uniref:MarR family winged helix-turn-helix transcriptional regulator n=1 Tax=Vibrio sp. WXL210 TaxID=3450709 RepID=UPI003EC64309